MLLDLIFSAMLIAAMLALLLTLARGDTPAALRGASALDLRRLRLAEGERDRDRGLLDAASADAASNEAARMLLRATDRELPEVERGSEEGAGRAGPDSTEPPRRLSRWIPVIAVSSNEGSLKCACRVAEAGAFI